MFKERQVIKDILAVLYVEHDTDEQVVNPDKEWEVDAIEEVARILSDNGYVPEHAVTMHPEREIAVTWDTDDVMVSAREFYDVKLTTEQAVGILERVELRHDRDVGINWSVIDAAIVSRPTKDGCNEQT